MSHKPELPVEVVTQIEKEAEAYSETRADHLRNIVEYNTFNDVNGGYIAGATAYATKLHHAQQENTELNRQNEKLKAQAAGWRPLLEKVLQRHEGGLLPDRLLYLEIKKFLYGE